MKLHTYFRSSAAYRVRIALNLKGLAYQSIPVHLLQDGGQQHRPDYLALNPMASVPTLQTDDQTSLTQSLAIMEYLDETHPRQPLLPPTPEGRAWVRAVAQAVACDIHPLNNLRVLSYLTDTLSVTPAQKTAWYLHWVDQGLRGIERMLRQQPASGAFCYGDTPTLADCCLVPQVFNAERFGYRLDDLPRIQRIVAHCMQLPAFQAAAPERQPDAPVTS